MSAPTRRRRGVARVPVRKAGSQSFSPAADTPPEIMEALDEQGMNATSNFGPGQPLRPYQGYSQPPRVMDYPVGVNISVRTRQSWGRMSFETIKAIVDAYDVARMCINHKIDELRSMEPMYLPMDGFEGDADAAIDAARTAMEFPDRELPFDAWLNKLMENALRYDAPTLYRRRNLAGEVIGLEVVDGTTVFPYVDENGRRPRPPAPAYYQLIHGTPWNWYTSNDLIYVPFRPQADNPYGLAPMESLLLTANTDLRFQWHFLQMFTEGSVPAGFVETPPDLSSPDQVAEWQDYWDAVVMGDQAKMHQLVAVPNGTKVTGTKPDAFDSAFPEYLMMRTCAAHGVVPQDLGLIKDVNRANGETQVDVQFRVNTLPWVLWLQGIVSRYLRYDLGLPVQMKLDTGRDKEDRAAEATAWGLYIDKGIASADEARQELLGLPIDNERPVPRFYADPRTGPIPLTNILSIAGKIDPETAAPVDDEPLGTEPYNGAEGVLPDKAPGGTQFKRAVTNPDEPRFPELEKPVPGSDVVGTKPGTPVIGQDGVTADSGIEDSHLIKKSDQAAAEMQAFERFAKARSRSGKWRDFTFVHTPASVGAALNAYHRERVAKAAEGDGDDGSEPSSVVAAGLAVQAVDTGRVLMLQRALVDDDPAAGTWEFPGGCIEPGEQPQEAACREWCEEVGVDLPEGEITDTWLSGRYRGYVYTIPAEVQVDLRARGEVINPDDPDGDLTEAVAWFMPEQLVDNPTVRPELAASLDVVLDSVAAAIDEFLAEPAATCPCGAAVEFDEVDGWQHADGSISHDDGESVSDKMSAVAKSDPAWYEHPDRHVDEALTDYHTPAIQAGLSALVDRKQLRSLVSAYFDDHQVAKEGWNPQTQPRGDNGRFEPGGQSKESAPSEHASGSTVSGSTAGTMTEQLHENGGFTVDPASGASPSTGYQVGIEGHTMTIGGAIPSMSQIDSMSQEELAGHVQSWMDSNAQLFSQPGMMVGGWHDTSTGLVHFDVSQHVGSLDQAVSLGRAGNQISVWDNANMTEIPTGGTGDSGSG